MVKKIALSLLFLVGMAVMGATTGLLAPAVPVIAGFAVAFASAAVPALGQAGAAIGLLGYGGGVCAAMLLVQPDWMGLAAWYAAFLMIGHVLVQVMLHKKYPLIQVMLYTGVYLAVIGLASYVALYYIAGDGVALVMAAMESEMNALMEISPQAYDMLLSLMSARGYLADVGLENYVLELDPQTRKVLSASLMELLSGSLRMSLLDILAGQSLNIGFIAPLLTVFSYAKKGEGDKVSKIPDLTKVRIPRKVSMILFIAVVAGMVLMLLVDAATPVYVALMTVFEFVYAVQGLSLGEWFFRRKGVNRAVRYLLMGTLFVLLPTVLFFAGFIEQMFGFRKLQELKDSGVLDEMRRMRNEELERKLQELEEKQRREEEKDDNDSHRM